MLTKEKIRRILSSNIDEISSLSIPHFSLLSDIEKAAKRVKKAINNNEKIVIIGDYDVDGVCSSAIMYLFLSNIYNNFEVKIPNRFNDGYGLTSKLLEDIDADLIITVDNGISAFEAAVECEKRGIDLIITDHHTPKIAEKESKSDNNQFVLPKAYAIINPKTSPDFPFKEICGAQVAWYLCAAIKSEMGLNTDLREYLDIVALAIIADVMPLQNLNRVLVSMGLKRLNNPKRVFAKVLKNYFKNIKASDIAFNIAPRLNAAGRIEDAKKAFEFLISSDYNEAIKLYSELDRLNDLRKNIEKEILDSINVSDEENFILVKGDYHEGVLGIVASRLVYKYQKPAIVFSEDKNILKGSGRSLGNIDIFELISECEEFLEGFGGHKLACGVKIKEDNFDKLKEELNKKIERYKKEDFFKEDFVLGELPFSEIDIELLDILNFYEPYGEGNPKPKFITTARIENIKNLKDNHYKLILSQNDIFLEALIFRYDGEFDEVITFKFSIEENNYQGRRPQLIIEEIL